MEVALRPGMGNWGTWNASSGGARGRHTDKPGWNIPAGIGVAGGCEWRALWGATGGGQVSQAGSGGRAGERGPGIIVHPAGEGCPEGRAAGAGSGAPKNV